MHKSQKILVTGAEGLIGASLSKALVERGDTVIGLDIRFPTDHPFYGDTRNPSDVTRAVSDCDGIVHLAALSRVAWGEKEPATCLEVNVTGTENVIKAALDSPKKPWVLFSSSREVYGQPESLPVTEDHPLRPMNTYARTKVAGEAMMMDARAKGLITGILRYSNVYGSPNDHADRVIPAFCLAALSDMPPQVEGRNHMFDFTYISDAIAGTLKMIDKLHNRETLPPIQLGTGTGTTLYELAQLILTQTQSKAQIEDAPPRTFDVDQFTANTQKAKTLLDWEAKITLKDGIQKLLSAF